MPDKDRKRFYKAKKRAEQILAWNGYRATPFSDGVFDLEASDENEIKKIKICLDSISDHDIKQIQGINLPTFCKREIWMKKRDSPDFEIIKIKPCQ